MKVPADPLTYWVVVGFTLLTPTRNNPMESPAGRPAGAVQVTVRGAPAATVPGEAPNVTASPDDAVALTENGAAPYVTFGRALKVLVWQDAAGKTWLSYNDPAWLAKRHGLPADIGATVKAVSDMLKAVTAAATAAK